jgi:hypothetical protein
MCGCNLYRIRFLKSAPELIPLTPLDRVDGEPWEIEHRVVVFQHFIDQEEVNSRFCFFIDGLDEYDGCKGAIG